MDLKANLLKALVIRNAHLEETRKIRNGIQSLQYTIHKCLQVENLKHVLVRKLIIAVVGRQKSLSVMKNLGFDRNITVSRLTEEQLSKLFQWAKEQEQEEIIVKPAIME